MTRVLIVDDHAGFRSSARRLLEAEGLEVVGEAGDGAEGVARARVLRPDLVLLDVELPDADGFAVAAELTRAANGPAVILTSSREAADFGPLVAASGARGFVAKAELSAAALARLLR
ncbi:MAG: response regulator transcription factor [Thermoleophilia bacterium]|nr:response regulator transcription factor [Thermoleophilia bacterium]